MSRDGARRQSQCPTTGDCFYLLDGGPSRLVIGRRELVGEVVEGERDSWSHKDMFNYGNARPRRRRHQRMCPAAVGDPGRVEGRMSSPSSEISVRGWVDGELGCVEGAGEGAADGVISSNRPWQGWLSIANGTQAGGDPKTAGKELQSISQPTCSVSLLYKGYHRRAGQHALSIRNTAVAW